MANWCSNQVNFHANSLTLKKIKILVLKLARNESKTNEGQLPGFLKDVKGFMFCIRWEDDMLYYDTKWCPNVETIIAFADHFQTGFRHSYYELGMCIYGEYNYKNGILSNISLDTTDFDSFESIDDEDQWKFEDKIYESEFDILEILLERKQAVVIKI